MKNFDRHHPDNLALYNDSAYKVVSADKVLDLGLYEDVVLKNGRTVQRLSLIHILESNLGTIAHSGSLEFKQKLEEGTSDVDIIGQFGVGFYSAFMVAQRIIVETRSAQSEQAYSWISNGEDGYTIAPIMKEDVGTKIILELKEERDVYKRQASLIHGFPVFPG